MGDVRINLKSKLIVILNMLLIAVYVIFCCYNVNKYISLKKVQIEMRTSEIVLHEKEGEFDVHLSDDLFLSDVYCKRGVRKGGSR